MYQEKNDQYKTYTYRIYPTDKQKYELEKRFVLMDTAFDQWTELANEGFQQGLSESEVAANIRTLRFNSEFPDVRYAYGVTQHQMIRLLHRLYTGEIEWIKPRLVYRANKKYIYKNLSVENQSLNLPLLEVVKMSYHRPFPEDAKVCYAWVNQDCYGESYHIDIVIQVKACHVEPQPIRYSRVVGLDYEQDGLFVTDTGENGGYPGFRRLAKEKLKRYYEIASRFHVGSRRWLKFRKRAAALEQHIVNQRRDWQYKKAHELVDHNDMICTESLHVERMKRDNPALIPKLNDNGIVGFLRKLERLLSAAGKRLMQVDMYYPSSQICSCCGKRIGKQPLGNPFVYCPHCGTWINRNHNAARNIRAEGIRMLDFGIN